MATSMRLRLHFDGTVCTHISPRKCWFLVNVDNCNVVADLEYLIRERFELDKGIKLSLYIDDFLLPSMENIHVVRDNDTLWIKLTEAEDHVLHSREEESPKLPTECSPERMEVSQREEKLEERRKSKNRKRTLCGTSPEPSPRKQKRNKDKPLDSLNHPTKGKNGTSGSDSTRKQKKQRRKDKHSDEIIQKVPSVKISESPSVSNANTQSKQARSKKKSLSVGDHGKNAEKLLSGQETMLEGRRDRTESSDQAESQSSSTRKAQHDMGLGVASDSSKVGWKTSSKQSCGSRDDKVVKEQRGDVSSEPSANVNTLPNRVPQTANTLSPSDGVIRGTALSSALESSRDLPAKAKGKKLSRTVLSSSHIRFGSSSSESESEPEDSPTSKVSGETNNETINKKADPEQTNREISVKSTLGDTILTAGQSLDNTRSAYIPSTCPSQDIGSKLQALSNGHVSPDRRLSQMNGSPSMLRTSNDSRENRLNVATGNEMDDNNQLTSSQSNTSIITKTPHQEPELPPKDYASFPALVGPPRQGDVIAYRVLELSESYCPELSAYKEAKVLSVDASTGHIEVELDSVCVASRQFKPGKFDLLWGEEEEDHEDNVYIGGSSTDTVVCLQLQNLVEPRLVPLTSH